MIYFRDHWGFIKVKFYPVDTYKKRVFFNLLNA